MKDSISFTWSVNCVGGGERLGASHPLHLQRAPRLPDLLAHLRHHGSPTLCRQILQGESNHNWSTSLHFAILRLSFKIICTVQ